MFVCLFASVLVCVSVFVHAFRCLFGVRVCRVLVVCLFVYLLFFSLFVHLFVRSCGVLVVCSVVCVFGCPFVHFL